MEFDIKLVHTPENKMVQSDALSQQPDLCPDNDTDNENMIMLPDNMFLNLIDMDLQQKITMTDDRIHLEDEADIRLVYGWNRYRHVFCGQYSINPVSMSKIRYCSI